MIRDGLSLSDVLASHLTGYNWIVSDLLGIHYKRQQLHPRIRAHCTRDSTTTTES